MTGYAENEVEITSEFSHTGGEFVTYTGGWYCYRCKNFIPYGIVHICSDLCPYVDSCSTCPWRITCANAKPTCYKEK